MATPITNRGCRADHKGAKHSLKERLSRTIVGAISASAIALTAIILTVQAAVYAIELVVKSHIIALIITALITASISWIIYRISVRSAVKQCEVCITTIDNLCEIAKQYYRIFRRFI